MAGSPLVQSVVRALDALELLARSEGGLRLRDVAAELSVGDSTAHNLLRTLAARGYVCQSSRNRRYRLGPALPRVAQVLSQGRLMRAAEQAVRRTHERCPGPTVTFATPLHAEVVVRLRLAAERPGVVERPLGRVFAPYSTASGLLHLAYCAGEHGATIRRRHPFAEHGAHLWATRRELEVYLEAVRNKGFAVPPFDRDVCRVAAPVVGTGDELVGIVGLCAVVNEEKERQEQESELSEAALQAAAEVAAEISEEKTE